MKLRLTGSAAVAKRLDALSARASGKVLATAGMAAGLPIARRWKELFGSPDSASVAGAPPRRQTGTYSRSVHVEVAVVERSRAVVTVGTNITDPPYPWFLEFGTSKMAAHPIARPAFEQSKDEAAKEGRRVLLDQLDL